jgi:signal transduction histidine kinase
LRSALSNLIRNAIKLSKSGDTIWLRAKEAQGRVLIEVGRVRRPSRGRSAEA